MSVRGKNPTAFYGMGNREQRIGKSFKSFIYLTIVILNKDEIFFYAETY
jgi:hypothetical protein